MGAPRFLSVVVFAKPCYQGTAGLMMQRFSVG
jgi:hypothetical protein